MYYLRGAAFKIK